MNGRLLTVAVAALAAVQAFGGGIDRQMLKDFIALPSVNRNPVELRRGVEFLKDWLEKRNVRCAVETNECGYLGLYASTTPGKVHDYLFVAHVDVVKAPPEMFVPRVDGDRIYGRGACDTKGNVAMMCQVLANLAGRVSLGMFIATDEEGGGEGTRIPQMMIDRGYVPRKLILVGDTAGEEPGQLFTAEKGHARITLVAHGKGGHSSRPWALDNPVPKLCEGYLRFKRAWQPDADPDEHWRTVLSPTMIHASEADNVVADTATMGLSCRYVSMADYEKAIALLRSTGLEVIADPGRRPVENRPGDPEIAALLKAMKSDLPGGIREGRMSAATDASFYAACGVPIVIFTAEGGEPHSVREWGSLKSLDEYARFFTDYLGRRAALR